MCIDTAEPEYQNFDLNDIFFQLKSTRIPLGIASAVTVFTRFGSQQLAAVRRPQKNTKEQREKTFLQILAKRYYDYIIFLFH